MIWIFQNKYNQVSNVLLVPERNNEGEVVIFLGKLLRDTIHLNIQQFPEIFIHTLRAHEYRNHEENFRYLTDSSVKA